MENSMPIPVNPQTPTHAPAPSVVPAAGVVPAPAPGAVVAQDPKPTATKKEPGEKVAKVKKEGAVARPRLPKYPDEHVITVFKENAKSRGAADRFKRYQTGMTVKAYVEKIKEDFARTDGQTFADMRWDEDHKFIHIGESTVPVPPPPPPKETKEPKEKESATVQASA
jgi:hypothetical protein